MEEDEAPKRVTRHAIGEPLDTLSIRDFDDRIALLQAEIERLEQAKRQKRSALDQADAFFKR